MSTDLQDPDSEPQGPRMPDQLVEAVLLAETHKAELLVAIQAHQQAVASEAAASQAVVDTKSIQDKKTEQLQATGTALESLVKSLYSPPAA